MLELSRRDARTELLKQSCESIYLLLLITVSERGSLKATARLSYLREISFMSHSKYLDRSCTTLPRSRKVGEKGKRESVKAKMMEEQFVERQTGVRKLPRTLELFDG